MKVKVVRRPNSDENLRLAGQYLIRCLMRDIKNGKISKEDFEKYKNGSS